jgi:hypothetical protein
MGDQIAQRVRRHGQFDGWAEFRVQFEKPAIGRSIGVSAWSLKVAVREGRADMSGRAVTRHVCAALDEVP